MTLQKINRKPANYKGIGRPTKLTPQLQENICKYISKGNYFITACTAAGISNRAFYLWLERAKQEEDDGLENGLYFQFMQAVKKAEAIAEAARVERIAQAGEGGQVSKRRITTFRDGTQTIEESFSIGQWLADMTHLERRHPERWGRPAPVQPVIDASSRTVNIIVMDKETKGLIARVKERTNKLIEGEVVHIDDN